MAQRFLRYASGNGGAGAKEDQSPANITGESNYLYYTNAGINLGSTEIFPPGSTGTIGSPNEGSGTLQIYFGNNNNNTPGADGSTYDVRCFGFPTSGTNAAQIAYINGACAKMITISTGGTGGTIAAGFTAAGYPFTSATPAAALAALNTQSNSSGLTGGSFALVCVIDGSYAT